MSLKANEAVVQRYFEAAQGGDVDALLQTVHSEAELRVPFSLPFGGVYRGHAGFREALPKMMAAWRKLEMLKTTVVSNDRYVIVLTTTRNTSQANGNEGEIEIAEVFELQENKIIAVQPYYFDTAQMKQVFGWQ